VDLTDGYWSLDSTDQQGASWSDSALTFTSATPDTGGTLAVTARLDWFNEFGFAGSETAAGSFDPSTNHLILEQSDDDGSTSSVVDHYEATYDASTDRLVDGFWSTGVPGTFTAQRVLSSQWLGEVQAVATEEDLAPNNSAMLVDGDLLTFWRTPRGSLTGISITFTLAQPRRLEGVRIFAPRNGPRYATPQALTVVVSDATGAELESTTIDLAQSALWQAFPLTVGGQAAEVRIDIASAFNPTGNWLSINDVEFFGE
jgi:hypothetical protein